MCRVAVGLCTLYTVCRYSRYYEPLLAPLAQAPVRLLEIGVEDGRSLAAWRRYFPQVMAYVVWNILFIVIPVIWSSVILSSCHPVIK